MSGSSLRGLAEEPAIDNPSEAVALKAELRQLGHLLGLHHDAALDLQILVLAVLQLLQQHDLAGRPLSWSERPTIRGETERQLVGMLAARFRTLPEEQRRHLPTLLQALAKLEVATGEFDAAQRDFQEFAQLVADARVQAEAH